jgi:endonuclease YncB( thermonuclease family)
MQDLENISEIKEWCLSGNYNCRLQRCYDGDTCTVIIFYNKIYTTFNIRLFGIDTPEKNGVNHTKAISSRNKLISLLSDQDIDINYEYSKDELHEIFEKNKKIVRLQCVDIKDKYGRILGNFYTTESHESVNNSLIQQGFATPYDGGKKLVN